MFRNKYHDVVLYLFSDTKSTLYIGIQLISESVVPLMGCDQIYVNSSVAAPKVRGPGANSDYDQIGSAPAQAKKGSPSSIHTLTVFILSS